LEDEFNYLMRHCRFKQGFRLCQLLEPWVGCCCSSGSAQRCRTRWRWFRVYSVRWTCSEDSGEAADEGIL
jgi:hypothetical protein